MSLVPPNAPCPCGSGLKYKRCCLNRERELVRNADALEVLSGLGALFPLMRPCGGDLESWLAAHASPEPDPEAIETGVLRLTSEERRAFVGAYASFYPDFWLELVSDAGGAETAESLAIAGAVAAALTETRTPNPSALELLDDAGDAAEELALVIDATNLWSIDEAAGLDEVLAQLDSYFDDDADDVLWNAIVADVAARFWTDLHARRLDVLVERVRGYLLGLEPSARKILDRACAAYERDATTRRRVCALLLSDTLGPLFAVNSSFAAAA